LYRQAHLLNTIAATASRPRSARMRSDSRSMQLVTACDLPIVDGPSTRSTFAGRDELLAQVDGLEHEDGPLTMMRLRLSRDFPASHDVRNPVPNSPSVVDHDGHGIGMLLLWLDDSGYIDCLEYAWVTDEIPTRLPDPNGHVKWMV
jgi:hypothetical protein